MALTPTTLTPTSLTPTSLTPTKADRFSVGPWTIGWQAEPSRTEDYDGVWESVRANMRTYLILKDRATAFRSDPEVHEALAQARVSELSQPTLNDGEGYAELLADPSSFEEFDADTTGAKGFGFVRLNQLALEHLTGAASDAG